jgi:hypothetical protein
MIFGEKNRKFYNDEMKEIAIFSMRGKKTACFPIFGWDRRTETLLI